MGPVDAGGDFDLFFKDGTVGGGEKLFVGVHGAVVDVQRGNRRNPWGAIRARPFLRRGDAASSGARRRICGGGIRAWKWSA